MALRDQPYFPFYVDDFLTDEKLLRCSAATTGVYIRLLGWMHKSEKYGTFSIKEKDRVSDDIWDDFARVFTRFSPYDSATVRDAFQELFDEEVIYTYRNSICQKRMMKDGEISDKRALAGKKGMDARYENNQEFCYNKTPNKQTTRELTNQQQNTENENEYVIVNGFKDLKGVADKANSIPRAQGEQGETENNEFCDTGFQRVVRAYEDNLGTMPGTHMHQLKDWLQEMEPEVVIYAIIAAANNGARNMNYVNSVLRNLHNSNVKTEQGLIAHEAAYKNQKAQRKAGSGPGPPAESRYVNLMGYEPGRNLS